MTKKKKSSAKKADKLVKITLKNNSIIWWTFYKAWETIEVSEKLSLYKIIK